MKAKEPIVPHAIALKRQHFNSKNLAINYCYHFPLIKLHYFIFLKFSYQKMFYRVLIMVLYLNYLE
jgi:hypothetical protein